MTMNWPAEIAAWRDKYLYAPVRALAARAEKCPHCGNTHWELRRYGSTGELGDWYCLNEACRKYIRPWNAH